MRESMLLSLKTPNTGMAVAIDVGDAKNIHPKNKQAVGQRLAQWALAETYGQNIPASGPLYISHRAQDGRVTVTFERAHGLRTSGGQPPKGFAIAGQDRQWHWAQSKIEGRAIVVWHPQVKSPVAVRYAFGDNPQCNLENGAGLPASPFRTDDW
jgi:sialate O-acetylesterase